MEILVCITKCLSKSYPEDGKDVVSKNEELRVEGCMTNEHVLE